MLSNTPFLRRVALPILVRPGFWSVSLGIGLITLTMGMPSDKLILFYVGLASVFAGVSAMRALDDDQASGTLEQLDVLPVSRERMVLEIATGSMLAFGALNALGMGIGSMGVRRAGGLAMLFNQLPAVLASTLLGTLLTLRHGMRWPARLLSAAILMLACLAGIGLFFDVRTPHAAPVAACLSVVKVAGLLAMWAALWKLGHQLGGGWSGHDVAHAVRGADPERGSRAGPARPVPDGWNPLFWRELNAGWRPLALVFALGAIFVINGRSAGPHGDSPFERACGCACYLVFWACIASSMRTAADRLSGLWSDLAPTPLSRWALLSSRVRGMLLQGTLLALGWVGLGYGLEVFMSVPRLMGSQDFMICALALVCMNAGAILAGFCTGTSGSGFIGGIGAVALFFVMMMFTMVPGAVAAGILASGRTSPVALIVGLGGSGAVLCGPLIWGSLRGIASATVEQRG